MSYEYVCIPIVLDEVELWIVMTSMVSGALMYTIMVANAAAMMSNVDAPAKVFKNKVGIFIYSFITKRGVICVLQS